MVDQLNTLRLFRDVAITRDYSVVHDLTPKAWLTYLIDNASGVTYTNVNYYRVPSVIRIEGYYDTLRKATYGVLYDPNYASAGTVTFERPYFFWVDEVRLVKAGTVSDTSGSVTNIKDTVELVISPDVWSNCNGQFELYDSWIVRRHMDRWYDDGGNKKPEYYPDAADPVGGAYTVESDTDLTPSIETSYSGTDYEVDLKWIIINVLDNNGKQKFYIGCVATDDLSGDDILVSFGATIAPIAFTFDDLTSGKFFDRAGITVDYIQSITVVPELSKFASVAAMSVYLGTPCVYFPTDDWDWTQYFDAVNVATADDSLPMYYLTCVDNTTMNMLRDGLYAANTDTVDPSAPVWDDPTLATQYKDAREPMMYRSPARIRKVVNGVGGAVIDVPDIEAFRTVYSVRNLIDLSTAVTFVFGGTDVVTANGVGNVGVVEAATLPIYSSAWKSYSAINKVGDEIAYNAQQASAVANGLAGAAAAGGMGAMAGGPIGAVLGAVTSLVGTGTQMYSNSENLRAKQTVIQNSPCNVKSSGSGLGATVADWIDVRYLVLKLDDVSLEKLRTQYYYFGYNVGEVAAGTVSLATRKYFDYIETKGARVRGDLNAAEAQQIAGIFDRGVRIYHGTDGYAQIGAGMALENYEV